MASASLLCVPCSSSRTCATLGTSRCYHRGAPVARTLRRGDANPTRLPPARAAPQDDELRRIQADLEYFRLRSRQGGGGAGLEEPTQRRQQQQQQQDPAARSSGGTALDGLKEGVDKLLIADFFFVLAALAWLGAGLAQRSLLGSSVSRGGWRRCRQLV